MKITALITALFQAATAAFKAFPLWLAWKLARDIERLTERILKHEAANTPLDLRRAGELQIPLGIYRRLYGFVLATLPADSSGDHYQDIGRAIPVPEG